MNFNEKRFNQIIKESIDNFINELEQIAVGGSEDWKPYDDGYEGKMRRMNVKSINRAYDAEMDRRLNMPKKEYAQVNPPTYNEWKNKYGHMSYSQYVEKKKNGEI